MANWSERILSQRMATHSGRGGMVAAEPIQYESFISWIPKSRPTITFCFISVLIVGLRCCLPLSNWNKFLHAKSPFYHNLHTHINIQTHIQMLSPSTTNQPSNHSEYDGKRNDNQKERERESKRKIRLLIFFSTSLLQIEHNDQTVSTHYICMHRHTHTLVLR